jgi:hypothetical protein
MKITIDAPPHQNLHFGGGASTEPITEIALTLPAGSSMEEMVTAFKTVLYAQTYNPDTINRAFGEDEDE